MQRKVILLRRQSPAQTKRQVKIGAAGTPLFKADIGECSLDGIVSNLERIMRSTTTDAQYDAALTAFSDHPDLVEPMLHWACRDYQDGLDLFNNLIELRPA